MNFINGIKKWASNDLILSSKDNRFFMIIMLANLSLLNFNLSWGMELSYSINSITLCYIIITTILTIIAAISFKMQRHLDIGYRRTHNGDDFGVFDGLIRTVIKDKLVLNLFAVIAIFSCYNSKHVLFGQIIMGAFVVFTIATKIIKNELNTRVKLKLVDN